jgi:hypothetical protein
MFVLVWLVLQHSTDQVLTASLETDVRQAALISDFRCFGLLVTN